MPRMGLPSQLLRSATSIQQAAYPVHDLTPLDTGWLCQVKATVHALHVLADLQVPDSDRGDRLNDHHLCRP